MKLIPPQIQHYIKGHSDLARVSRNVGWITLERAIRLLIGLFVMSLLARYLGPEDFGLLSLGIAIISMSIPFTELGLQGVIIKAHVENPQDTSLIVGTVFSLRLIGALISTAVAIGIALFIPSGDTQLLIVVVLLSFTAIFRTSDSFKHIFEARVLSKPVVLAELTASLITSAIKIGAILAGFTVLSFALIQSIEFAIAAACILVTYRHHIGKISDSRFSLSRAIEFLRLGWPLLLSFFSVTIYMRIDQLMISTLLGKTEVGIYSIAVRLSEVWHFVPVSIVFTTFPFLVEARKTDSAFYERRLVRLLRSLLLLAIAVATLISLSSSLLIDQLFGADYEMASEVLLLHTWGAVFVVLSMVSRYWAINENHQYLEIARTGSGAVLNVVLNLYLIPNFGIKGAAYATLIAHFWSGFLFDFTHPATRRILRHKIFAACFWANNLEACVRSSTRLSRP